MRAGMICGRVADNVLGEGHWSVFTIRFVDEIVVEVKELFRGVHAMPIDLEGLTIEDVASWSEFDATGDQVEQYHELFVELDPSSPVDRTKTWQAWVDVDELRKAIA